MSPIKVRIPDTLVQSKITQVELDFRELRLAVERDGAPHDVTAIPPGIAAGDPGVIRLLTVTDGDKTLSISGKALRSELQRHNKTKADLASKRSRCKKGSRQYRKYSKALAKSYQRWENWQRNFLHHSANMVAEWALERHVAELVVGDIAEIGRGKKGKSSRRNNQNLSGIPWGRFFKLLEYKLERVGCVLKKVDESYTTQTCPACGHRHKPAKRLYRCSNPSCGFEGVRDEVGAANTLTKYVMDGVIVPGFIVPKGDIKYRRPVKSCNKVGRRRCVDAHLGDAIPVLPANTFAGSQIVCRSKRLGSLPRAEQAHRAAPTAA